MTDAPAAHSRSNGVTEPQTPYLGREERILLEQGKAAHRETTAAARRALQASRHLPAGSTCHEMPGFYLCLAP